MMIQALIFDMDGTLVDSEKVHYDAWKATLTQYGVTPFSFASFMQYVGASNEILAEDYIESHDLQASVEQMVHEKQDIYLEMIPQIKPLPGVMEILTRFHSKFRLGIASSSHLVELEKILESLDISSYFEHVVGGDMIANKKPDPEIYLYSADLFQLTPGECVAFEDSEPGILAAKSAGLYGIAIPNSLSTGHDFSLADRVLNRMDQLDEQLLLDMAG